LAAEEKCTEFEFVIVDEYSIPLPVYIPKGTEFYDQVQFSIRIKEIIMEGLQISPRRVIGVVESDIRKVISSSFRWHCFELWTGESGFMLPEKLPWEENVYLSWDIPDTWESLIVKYSFHDASGKSIAHYIGKYSKDKKVQPVAGGDATR
jgi:hypothetical protein